MSGRALLLLGVAVALAAAARADAGVEDAAGSGDGAVDAGLADATPPSCGTLTAQGRCSADLLSYCDHGVAVTLDCSDPEQFLLGGPHATCGLVDCSSVGCVGFGCVARQGEACGELGCNVGLGLGCLDGVCAPSSVCDPLLTAPICEGSAVRYCQGTIHRFDCSAGGTVAATCGLTRAGQYNCLGTEGGPCDEQRSRECQAPLRCQQGVCVTAAEDAGWEEDAATATDAGRRDAGSSPPPPGCGCRGSDPRLGAGALLLLGGLLRRRRRPTGR